jgi:hypothetical protein
MVSQQRLLRLEMIIGIINEFGYDCSYHIPAFARVHRVVHVVHDAEKLFVLLVDSRHIDRVFIAPF